MKQVFISYAREDQVLALHLRNTLEANGTYAWLDTYNLEAGNQWEALIQQKIVKSDHVIYIHSKHSAFKNGPVRNEIVLALTIAKNKPANSNYLIVVNVDNANAEFIDLSHYHWVDLSQGFIDTYHRIEAAMSTLSNTKQEANQSNELFSSHHQRPYTALIEKNYSFALNNLEQSFSFSTPDPFQRFMLAIAYTRGKPLAQLKYREATNIQKQLNSAFSQSKICGVAFFMAALLVDYFHSNNVQSNMPSLESLLHFLKTNKMNIKEEWLISTINIRLKTLKLINL